jgi:hypothetical protein
MVRRHRLQGEFEADLAAEVKRVGGADHFDKGPLVRAWEDKGISRATLYRWIEAGMKSGRPTQALARDVKAAAKARAKRKRAPAADAAREIGKKLPVVVTVEDIAKHGTIQVIDQLHTCIQAAQDVLAHARTGDGKVKNAKLLLQASESLRRCLDTAARISDAMYQAAAVERFHKAIVEEVSKESPALAERVLARLSALANQWGG